ncbi:hypothetical protein PLICRDRAFT_26317 [Plicaturopsis crispa FD-325 SS-3]|nr:hypothetical protein PLICRDRAFT_26317 [Plicaturopsis crispa FD-325 SS-3]
MDKLPMDTFLPPLTRVKNMIKQFQKLSSSHGDLNDLVIARAVIYVGPDHTAQQASGVLAGSRLVKTMFTRYNIDVHLLLDDTTTILKLSDRQLNLKEGGMGNAPDKKTMVWKNFPELALTKELQILGWPHGVAVLGPQFDIVKLSTLSLLLISEPMKSIPWGYKDYRTIPLIISTTGTHVLTVNNVAASVDVAKDKKGEGTVIEVSGNDDDNKDDRALVDALHDNNIRAQMEAINCAHRALDSVGTSKSGQASGSSKRLDTGTLGRKQAFSAAKGATLPIAPSHVTNKVPVHRNPIKHPTVSANTRLRKHLREDNEMDVDVPADQFCPTLELPHCHIESDLYPSGYTVYEVDELHGVDKLNLSAYGYREDQHMRAMHHFTIDALLVKKDVAVFSSVINANSLIICPVKVWNIQPIGEEQYTHPNILMVDVAISKWRPDIASSNATLKVDWS